MPTIPRETLPDSTLSLFLDPYRFIPARCARHESNLFETRLLLRRTICMTGHEAAKLFYNAELTKRSGAAPGRLQKTLFGQGGVQGMDGEMHDQRKALLTGLVTPESVDELAEATAHEWREQAAHWADRETVVLYRALPEIIAPAVCRWAGVPWPEDRSKTRTREITALFDKAGSIGPRHWHARLARKRADRWMEGVVEAVRAGRLEAPAGSTLEQISTHRDVDGEQLSAHAAAVELMNLIRPTVAVAVYIVFCAHALHEYPETREALLGDQEGYVDAFVDEVRRFYPFFPAVIALAAQDFEWNGYKVAEGTQLVLDLYGTNHDLRVWGDPQAFRPERFFEQEITPYNFIPQGGGDVETNHRCPGEPVARALMKSAVEMLTQEMAYDVPRQDLAINFRRLPALPYSKFVMRQVRLID